MSRPSKQKVSTHCMKKHPHLSIPVSMLIASIHPPISYIHPSTFVLHTLEYRLKLAFLAARAMRASVHEVCVCDTFKSFCISFHIIHIPMTYLHTPLFLTTNHSSIFTSLPSITIHTNENPNRMVPLNSKDLAIGKKH